MKTLQCSKLSIILPEIEKFLNKFIMLLTQKGKGLDIKDRLSVNINALSYVSKICNTWVCC